MDYSWPQKIQFGLRPLKGAPPPIVITCHMPNEGALSFGEIPQFLPRGLYTRYNPAGHIIQPISNTRLQTSYVHKIFLRQQVKSSNASHFKLRQPINHVLQDHRRTRHHERRCRRRARRQTGFTRHVGRLDCRHRYQRGGEGRLFRSWPSVLTRMRMERRMAFVELAV